MFILRTLSIATFIFMFSVNSTNAITADPDRLMAVHLTDIPPKNGIMIPGCGHSNLRDKEGNEYLSQQDVLTIAANMPWRRFTLHWSLGGPVEQFDHSEGEMDWSHRNFAILEPLSQLLSQSIGGHAQDWATFGPHRLSSKAVILVPIGMESSITEQLRPQIQTYDKSTMNVRDAVTAYFRSHQLPLLKFDFATTSMLSLTPNSIDKFVKAVAELRPEAPKSSPIRSAFEAIARMGVPAYTNNFKLGFAQTGRKVMCMTDLKSLSEQLITVENENTTIGAYLKPVFDQHPHLKLKFAADFPNEKLDMLLRDLFIHAYFFRYAEKLEQTNPKVSNQLYLQSTQGDAVTIEKLQQQCGEAKRLLTEISALFPEAVQEAGKHWAMGIKVWLKYLTEHCIDLQKTGKPFYTQDHAAIAKHLSNVAATAKLNSIDKVMALYH